ncbi:hypothetical protein DLE01_00320 [Streptomyces sp. FT05W]|nr:hypothetical protein [Streptomyces sp. FT05W]PWS53166.1 hypothetical protein DLE01_00320 [Streptomyces sp. FT05W]
MPIGDLDKMVEHVNGRFTATVKATAKPKAATQNTQESDESMTPVEAIAHRLGAGRTKAPKKDTRNSAAAQLSNRLRGL